MSKKLYVGNLSFSSTEESIKDLFSQYGEVLSIKIPTDQMTGRPRGFCFVEMENAEEAINQLNNFTFDGRALKVNVARENPQGGGSRGFGRSGGFGNRNRNRNY
ncbi:MAG: RNA-binding protein [Fibrobacter sp.]|jgi:RNA recognition motif-containing protein|nr:RNA-binding protein [Fibrobacter sp.]